MIFFLKRILLKYVLYSFKYNDYVFCFCNKSLVLVLASVVATMTKIEITILCREILLTWTKSKDCYICKERKNKIIYLDVKTKLFFFSTFHFVLYIKLLCFFINKKKSQREQYYWYIELLCLQGCNRSCWPVANISWREPSNCRGSNTHFFNRN